MSQSLKIKVSDFSVKSRVGRKPGSLYNCASADSAGDGVENDGDITGDVTQFCAAPVPH